MSEHRVRVLLVGIDTYPGLDPDRKLRGAVADVRALAAILRSRVSNLELRILTEAEATRDKVLAALNALVDQIKPDEEVLFYWSGHGSQVKDASSDDEDGWDETLVPYDSGRGSKPNRDILDDEIHEWLGRLSAKTIRITLIIDSCHSGTVARTGVRGVPRDPRPRALDSPRERTQPKEATHGTSGWLPLSDRYVLLAACRDDQEAIELPFGGQFRGAFSWSLGKELEKAAEGATWREVFSRAQARVAVALSGDQIPQLEGARDRAIPGKSP